MLSLRGSGKLGKKFGQIRNIGKSVREMSLKKPRIDIDL